MGGWGSLRVLGALVFAVALPLAAHAAEDKPEPLPGWTFDAGLYGWALWVEGDATVKGLDFDVYADPIDLIDALDGPIIMGNFEAKKKRFSFLADAIYAKFHGDADFLVSFNPIGNLTLKGDGRIDADYEFGVYQAGGLYEVARMGPPSRATTFEFGGGARWVRQELNVTLGVNASATKELGNRLNVLENRINKIENRQQKVAALESVNALRQELLKQRIINAESSKVLQRRVSTLESRLGKVTQRGQALAAIAALQDFRLALLQERVGLANASVDGNLAYANSGLMEWVDPVVAARVRHEFTKGEAVSVMGDVGGFNTDSDFTWQVLLNYERDTTLFGYDSTVSLGYRALGLMFEEQTAKGTRGVNVVLHGPVAELSFRW